MSFNKTSDGMAYGSVEMELKSVFDSDFEVPEINADHLDITSDCTHSCTCSCTCGLNPF